MSRPTRTRPRWLVPLLVGLAVLPLLVSAVSMALRVGGSYHPGADQALIELQVRDIGHLPVLLGPYSRFGWFHPGPALYYALWLPYRLTGSTAVSIAIGALFVNGLSIAGIALLAWRRGGTTLLLTTLALLAALERGFGPQFAREVWNPYITVLPFVLFVFLVWSTSAGDVWALPVAIGVATFLVQTHVGYALMTAAVLGVGVAMLGVTEWRRRPPSAVRRRTWRWCGAVSAAVLVVLWAPVVVQQLFRSPGNVGTLARFFGDHGREQSYADAFHVVAAQLAAVPEWIRGATTPNLYSGAVELSGRVPVPVALLALVVAVVSAWKADRGAWRLNVVVLVAIGTGFLAVTRVVGEIFPYLVRWTWALGMLAWVAVAWTVVGVWRSRGVSDRHPEIGRAALGLVVAVFMVLTVWNVADAARAGDPDPQRSATVAKFADRIEAELPAGRGVVEIRSSGVGSTWAGAELADELERRGITTRVAPDLGFAYGPDRVVGDDRVKVVVLPMENADLDRQGAPDGFTEVARQGRVHLFLGAPRDRAPR